MEATAQNISDFHGARNRLKVFEAAMRNRPPVPPEATLAYEEKLRVMRAEVEAFPSEWDALYPEELASPAPAQTDLKDDLEAEMRRQLEGTSEVEAKF
ncbi:MAG: hypothetical protein ACAH88_03935 [Roseimicrobium sp.]